MQMNSSVSKVEEEVEMTRYNNQLILYNYVTVFLLFFFFPDLAACSNPITSVKKYSLSRATLLWRQTCETGGSRSAQCNILESCVTVFC